MSKREALLKAAGQILVEQGIAAVTLDAVAARAGVSKGGLLYHFSTKDALLGGVVAYHLGQFDALIEAAQDGEAPGRWLRAYVRVCTSNDPPIAVVSQVMVAITSSSINPDFLEMMRQAYARWRGRAQNDGVDAATAQIVRMAADGCWLYALHVTADDAGGKRELAQLRAQLLELLDGAIIPQAE